MTDYIDLKTAAERAKIDIAQLATSWRVAHGVSLVHDDATGKLLGVNRDEFERAVGGDPELARWISGDIRQEREAERSREQAQKHVHELLSGGRRQETSRSKTASQLLDLVASNPSTRRLRDPDAPAPASEPGSDAEIETLKRWLKL